MEVHRIAGGHQVKKLDGTLIDDISLVAMRASALDSLPIRDKIMLVEERMRARPDAMIGDSAPLVHSFAEGLYIREITMPAGYLAVTKIHKYSHAAFVLRGTVTIIEEGGMRTVSGPASFVTRAGTKRIVYCHTEVVWTTVHATRETDIDKIEDEIIAKRFDEREDVPHMAVSMEGRKPIEEVHV